MNNLIRKIREKINLGKSEMTKIFERKNTISKSKANRYVDKYQILNLFKRENIINLFDDGKMPKDYVIFDMETTGLYPEQDKITEFSLLKYKDNVLIDKMSELVNPRKRIPEIVERITGISNYMVKEMEDIEIYVDKIVQFIGDNVLIGHNINFDIDFLAASIIRNDKNYGKIQIKYIDTVELSKLVITGVSNYKLETLKNHLKIKVGSHRANSDCLVTNELYQYCKNIIEDQLEIKRIYFQKKMENINEDEKKFIDVIKEKIKNININLTNEIDFTSSNIIIFTVNSIEIGRIKLRGKKPSIQVISNYDSTWIENVTLDEAITLSDKWISYLKRIL